jgi:hypothetical protein
MGLLFRLIYTISLVLLVDTAKIFGLITRNNKIKPHLVVMKLFIVALLQPAVVSAEI